MEWSFRVGDSREDACIAPITCSPTPPTLCMSLAVSHAFQPIAKLRLTLPPATRPFCFPHPSSGGDSFCLLLR